MNPIRHALALASACLLCTGLLAGCGGGDAPSEPTSPEARPAAVIRSDFVRLEGCITDAQGRPLAAGVQALSVDGRLLANARSGTDGVFVLRVPARATVRLRPEAPGGDTLEILTGSTSLALTGCLFQA